MVKSSRHNLAIIFDFGNVLVDWDPRYLYRKLFDNDEEAMESFLQEIGFMEWNMQQDAGRSFNEGVEELCDRFPEHCDLIRAYDERWEESIGGPIWSTVEILDRLRMLGYPLLALSNWSAEKYALISKKYMFFDWFDDILLSGDLRVAKPDERIFQLLLERIGRPAGECTFIDDSIKNIEVARDLGFDVIHFTSAQQLLVELCNRQILCD